MCIYNMKILTWNTLASEWIKKSYYPNTNDDIIFDRKSRFEQITKIIDECDADVIMLQEVMKMEYSLLKKRLNRIYIISNLNKLNWYNTVSESGNVTIMKRSLFQDTEIQHQPCDYGLYTKCVYKGNVCVFFNIHFDDISRQVRYKQWNDLCLSCLPNGHVIVAGDFNHQYTKNSRIYNTNGFTTHNLCPTYYIGRKMNIDNIITRGFKKTKGNICPWYPDNIKDGFSTYGSDHMPVFIEVKLVA
jgi:mRNA deadenylase 3'-5' endonuclease subunit Ccr4